MNDISAINKLIDAVSELSDTIYATQNTVLTEIVAASIATVGSVIAVVVFEIIKNNIIMPRNEFKVLRRKVNETLIMHSRYYLHPMDIYNTEIKKQILDENKQIFEEYVAAAADIRARASEVQAFAEECRRGRYSGVKRSDIRLAGQSLMGLSNSFFYEKRAYDKDYNKIREDEIRKLLKLQKRN